MPDARRRGGRPTDGYSTAEAAALLGVTQRTVSGWLQAGCPHRAINGGRRVVLSEVVAWLREVERESARSEVAPDEAVERARKLRAEADLKELERDERRRRLIPVEELEEFLEGFVGGLAAVAAGRLQRFEREIVQAATPAAARKITMAIHAALMEGAREYGAEQQAMAEAEAEPAA